MFITEYEILMQILSITLKFDFPFGLNKENFPRQRLQILTKHNRIDTILLKMVELLPLDVLHGGNFGYSDCSKLEPHKYTIIISIVYFMGFSVHKKMPFMGQVILD